MTETTDQNDITINGYSTQGYLLGALIFVSTLGVAGVISAWMFGSWSAITIGLFQGQTITRLDKLSDHLERIQIQSAAISGPRKNEDLDHPAKPIPTTAVPITTQ